MRKRVGQGDGLIPLLRRKGSSGLSASEAQPCCTLRMAPMIVDLCRRRGFRPFSRLSGACLAAPRERERLPTLDRLPEGSPLPDCRCWTGVQFSYNPLCPLLGRCRPTLSRYSALRGSASSLLNLLHSVSSTLGWGSMTWGAAAGRKVVPKDVRGLH